MKRFLFFVALLVAAAGLVNSRPAVKSIDTYTGSIAVSLSSADSTGFITTNFSPIQISEMAGGSDAFDNKAYGAATGWFYLANLTDPGDSLVESYNDTLIIRYQIKSGTRLITVETDTSTLPCTVSFDWSSYPVDQWVAPNDSASALLQPAPETAWQWWMGDQFQVTYYVEDTAGTGGVLTGNIQYYLKFFELGD